ncbi:hypothetical protein OAU50_07470 [Planctomycetota bacterium]|nr:hypothetical protein [Planctomycetota bacterium]
MNQPPNTPPGYNQQYPPQQPPQQPQGHSNVPHSASYPAQHGFRGATRQMFNPASYKQPGSGSWAASSLIISLVSLVICLGLLSPISLILGFIGLFGNKRGKGLAFAGFLLSLVQVAGWTAVFVFGGLAVFEAESNANYAGAPVVAAIDQFKEDNDRVPHSLQELVDGGYLPVAWNENFGEMPEDVIEVVKGKKWEKFIAYMPGEDSRWEPGYFWDPKDYKPAPEHMDEFTEAAEKEALNSYGLAFIGMDDEWGSTDDSAVDQDPEEAFDLTELVGGSPELRELNKTRIELNRRLKQLRQRKEQLESAITSVNKDLASHEKTLRRLADDRGFTTVSEIRSDKVTASALKLIGETKKRQNLTQMQLKAVGNKIDAIGIEVSRLKNQEAMAKLSDSPELAAELEQLLEESKKALDDDSYFDDTSEDKYADEWFNENYR